LTRGNVAFPWDDEAPDRGKVPFPSSNGLPLQGKWISLLTTRRWIGGKRRSLLRRAVGTRERDVPRRGELFGRFVGLLRIAALRRTFAATERLNPEGGELLVAGAVVLLERDAEGCRLPAARLQELLDLARRLLLVAWWRSRSTTRLCTSSRVLRSFAWRCSI
jgi:hypothetical protein